MKVVEARGVTKSYANIDDIVALRYALLVEHLAPGSGWS